MTAKQWAEELELNYDVSVVFFNELGKEVFRNDAETASNRMKITMNYVLTKAYENEKQVNQWRRKSLLKQHAKSTK